MRLLQLFFLGWATLLWRFDFISRPSVIGSLASHVVVERLLLGFSFFVLGANIMNGDSSDKLDYRITSNLRKLRNLHSIYSIYLLIAKVYGTYQ